MSLDYYANNPNIEALGVNTSGASLLGWIFEVCGLTLCDGTPEMNLYRPRIPYTMNSRTASRCGHTIRKVITDNPESLKQIPIAHDGYWGDTPDEFLVFCSNFADFLETCQGYSVPE